MKKNNFDLKDYNSFSISAIAENFYQFSDENQLLEALKELNGEEFFILGSGNNVLFTGKAGNVIHSNINYITEIESDNECTYITAGSGTNWDDFVEYAVSNNLYGAENLTAIPSSVGATAVQNIGAYGVEAKDIIQNVVAYDCDAEEFTILSNEECQFGYRDSIFKSTSQYIIVSVTYKLSKIKTINKNYKDIADKLQNINSNDVDAKLVSKLIREIRESKLPNVKEIGNAGSFFKNPLISAEKFHELKELFPSLHGFESEGQYKISAAFLIEQAGLKGYRVGDAGVYEKHSLILVNHGSATGDEILAISNHVVKVVHNRFGVILVPEVEIL